jgi:hypothetical protein
VWFRLWQHRGFWAVVSCLLALGFAVSGALRASPVQAEPTSLRAATVDIAVVPSSVSVYVGLVFTLEIWVYPHGEQVDAVDADMTFDPAYLEVLSITGDPSALPDELFNAFDNGAGTLTHSRGILVGTPPSTDFRLCSIRLRAKATTEGTMLAFTDLAGAYFEGDPVLDDTIDGTVALPIPVGGVARRPDPGRVLAAWTPKLMAVAGLILGVAVVFRKAHRGV